MVCLETDFLVDLLRNKKEAKSKLEELVKKDLEITTTPVSLSELFHGAFKSKKQEKIEKVERIMTGINLLEYDSFASKKSGEIMALLDERGEKIGDKDTLIAGIALRHGEKIITRNISHFRKIPELELETY